MEQLTLNKREEIKKQALTPKRAPIKAVLQTSVLLGSPYQEVHYVKRFSEAGDRSTIRTLGRRPRRSPRRGRRTHRRRQHSEGIRSSSRHYRVLWRRSRCARRLVLWGALTPGRTTKPSMTARAARQPIISTASSAKPAGIRLPAWGSPTLPGDDSSCSTRITVIPPR